MENDEQVPTPAPVPRLSLPSLPPRAVRPVVEDTWSEVEAEPEYLHHSIDRVATEFTPKRQLWTQPPRILVLAGGVAGFAAGIGQLVVMLPSLRDATPHDADVASWFPSVVAAACLCFSIGWLWWATAAAFNARQLVPNMTSPFLPVGVFVVAPIVFGFERGLSGSIRDYVFVGAWVISALSYFIVVASLRSTARRIGAAAIQFTRMLWLPLGWVLYSVMVGLLVGAYEGPGSGSIWLLVPVLIGQLIFPVSLIVSTWVGFGSFTAACRRLNRREEELDLPAIDLMTKAFRQRVLESQ